MRGWGGFYQFRKFVAFAQDLPGACGRNIIFSSGLMGDLFLKALWNHFRQLERYRDGFLRGLDELFGQRMAGT